MEKIDLLNDAKADALCTLVAFGFMDTEKELKVEYEKKDKTEYEEVAKRFKKMMGKDLPIGESLSQQRMPYIVAKTKKVPTAARAQQVCDENRTYLDALHVNANTKFDSAPRGAYIGGLSTLGTLHLVGPSNLVLCKPVYRKINNSEQTLIQKAYNAAMESTNTALEAIGMTNIGLAKDKINTAYLIGKITREYEAGKLFKSYHGMIQAMAIYKQTMQPNDFIFEIAMGNKTTKVSSCIPCSIYMSANGNPPTSIHLGRGDNWNLPTTEYAALNANWQAKVLEYYTKAKAKCAGKGITIIDEFIRDLSQCGCSESEIPAIFLEALTYERSFADRIKNTINV